MAQSRLQKFASIFNRVEGFLRSGGIKPDDKPIWFDVYKRFPPVVEPIYLRPLPDINVKPIFYHEDKIRAEFYRVFGSPGIIDLMDSSNPTICDLFIEKYVEIAKSSQMNIDDVTLFNLTANRLRESGIKLRKYDGSNNIDLPDVNIDKPAMKSEKPKQNIDIASLMGNE